MRVALRLLAVVALLVSSSQAVAYELSRNPDTTPNVISPGLSAVPIDVEIWVRTDVSPEDEAHTVAKIQEGLALWEAVPTAHIRFVTTVIHTAVEPPLLYSLTPTLIINVANGVDIPTVGAFVPNAGWPGNWVGAIADSQAGAREHFELIAAHELGHSIGILHSSVTPPGFSSGLAVMGFSGLAAENGLSPDDIAAVSEAYPEPNAPLGDVTGTLHGETRDLANAQLLSGVNVVAVDSATGLPAVSRVTGAGGIPGEFDVRGLLPGTYTLHFLEGGSVGACCLGLPGDDIQGDNFDPIILGPFVVQAGDVIDVGDVDIPIYPMSFDAIGLSRGSHDVDPSLGVLPTAFVGEPYEVYMHLRGGVRPLASATVSGLPAGMTFELDTAQVGASGPNGDAFIKISGTHAVEETFNLVVDLTDHHGNQVSLPYDLPVEIPRPELAPIGPHAAATGNLLAIPVSASHPLGAALAFSVTNAPAGSAFPALGDVDEDGGLDSDDVDLIDDFVAGTSDPTLRQESLADINGSGLITSLDATQLAEVIAGTRAPLNTHVFLWTPDESLCDEVLVTFIVDDGAQTDSEVVAISIDTLVVVAPVPDTAVWGKLRIRIRDVCRTDPLEWSIGGAPFTLLDQRTGGRFRIRWDSETVADGTQTVTVRDVGGAVEATWPVRVDNVGPHLLQLKSAKYVYNFSETPANDKLSVKGQIELPNWDPATSSAHFVVMHGHGESATFMSLPPLECSPSGRCSGRDREAGPTGEGDIKVVLRPSGSLYRLTLKAQEALALARPDPAQPITLTFCADFGANCTGNKFAFESRGGRTLRFLRAR